MQKSASIEPRTSLSKFGGKSISLFIRLLSRAALVAIEADPPAGPRLDRVRGVGDPAHEGPVPVRRLHEHRVGAVGGRGPPNDRSLRNGAERVCLRVDRPGAHREPA